VETHYHGRDCLAKKRIDMKGQLSMKNYVSFKEPFGEGAIKVGGHRYGFSGDRTTLHRVTNSTKTLKSSLFLKVAFNNCFYSIIEKWCSENYPFFLG
jgi:hypothetical protein